ncbi:hypothetical protein HK100_009981, partial [Physocladia obscura]
MSSCTVLTNNTVCGPGFAGAVISNYASFIATVGQISNASTFTDAAHGCSASSALNNAVGAMRYQTAWACAVAVLEGCTSSSSNATSAASTYSTVTLCPVSASLAVTSYSLVYASSACPAIPTTKGLGKMAARNASLSLIIAQSLSASSTSCLLSVPSENICGFVNATLGAAFCLANPTQLCCVSPSLLQVPVVKGTVIYPTTNVASASSNTTDTGTTSGGMMLSNSAMAGLVVAVVAVLVGILVAINHFRKRKRANSVRSSKAYTFDADNGNQTPTDGRRPSFTAFPRKLSHASDKGSDLRQQKQQTPVPLASTAYASYNAIVKPASATTHSKQSSNNSNSHLAKPPPTIAILTSPRGREIKRPSPSDNSSSIQNNPSLAFRNQQTATLRSGFSSYSEVTDTNPSTKQITSSIQFNALRASGTGQGNAVAANNYNNNQFISTSSYSPPNVGNNYNNPAAAPAFNSLSRVATKDNGNALSAGSNSPSIEFIPIPGLE